METLLVYALITASAYYLGSRAKITSWLWSRYPPRLAAFMDCAACSGFWYGLAVGAVGVWGFQPTGPQPISLLEWYSPIVVGLCSIVWTPIVAGYMQAGFERLGTTVGDTIEVTDDAQT